MSGDMVAEKNGEMTLIPDTGVSQYYNEQQFDQIATAGGYLPRLQLFGANSDAVKEQKIPMAHYGLVRAKDQIEDLGTDVHLIPCSIRFAAMRLEEGNVVSVYNPEHAEFKRIMNDSEEQNSKCMYGPQFLVWLPLQKAFATMLFGSKTSRREGRNLKPLLRMAATLKVKLVSNKSYKWHTPIVVPCHSTLEAPDVAYLMEVADKFNNPDETSVEFDPTKMEGAGAAAGAAAATGSGERPR